MDLTPAVVESAATRYAELQPLSTIEEEHREILPGMLASGDFGWRDPEWVVQWCYRRFLGAHPNADRRVREAAYGENDYEEVRTALLSATDADEASSKLDHLTGLAGVGVQVGSAFLQFLHPDRYLVCSEREWSTLRRAGELDESYPDPPTVADYETYIEACRRVADRCDCSLWTLYRALWTIGAEDDDRR